MFLSISGFIRYHNGVIHNLDYYEQKSEISLIVGFFSKDSDEKIAKDRFYKNKENYNFNYI